MPKKSTRKKVLLLTVGEYAARRGVSREAIVNMIKRGTITKKAIVLRKGKTPGSVHKRIKPEVADLEIEFSGTPSKRPMTAKPSKQVAKSASAPAPADAPAEGKEGEPPLEEVEDKLDRYRDARTSTEELKARKLELEVQEREGLLISKKDALGTVAALVGETKNAILNLAPQLAPVLVSITDPLEMENRLREELNKALGSLARIEGKFTEERNDDQDPDEEP